MFTAHGSCNYSSVLSILYFVSYSVTFTLFFLTISHSLDYGNNLYSIVFFLKYSTRRFSFFIIAFVALLGIPPFNLFAPKFAALTSVYGCGGFFIFFCALSSVFLSFALYLQVFDVLFKPALEKPQIVKSTEKRPAAPCSEVFLDSRMLVFFCFFCGLGFLIFKDLFFVFYVAV